MRVCRLTNNKDASVALAKKKEKVRDGLSLLVLWVVLDLAANRLQTTLDRTASQIGDGEGSGGDDDLGSDRKHDILSYEGFIIRHVFSASKKKKERSYYRVIVSTSLQNGDYLSFIIEEVFSAREKGKSV